MLNQERSQFSRNLVRYSASVSYELVSKELRSLRRKVTSLLWSAFLFLVVCGHLERSGEVTGILHLSIRRANLSLDRKTGGQWSERVLENGCTNEVEGGDS